MVRTMDTLCPKESGYDQICENDIMPRIFVIRADRSAKYVWANVWQMMDSDAQDIYRGVRTATFTPV